MKTFDKYVSEWWHDYLTEHEDIEDLFLTAFNAVLNALTLRREDVLTEEENPIDFLTGLESDTVYDLFFGYNPKIDGMTLPDIPDTETFLHDAFLQAVDNDDEKRSFVADFVADMACHAQNYSDPIGFFQDLQHGGCQSGLVGMLIYNSDCKRIYIEHIDDMEDFKYQLEDELGEAIRDKIGLHYVFMCWLCYEELGFRIARNLYPNHF